MHIAGQVASRCAEGDLSHIVDYGEWVVGYANQMVANNPSLDLHDIINSLMESNGWNTFGEIPKLVPGQTVCMREDLFNVLHSAVDAGQPASICPGGGTECFTKGIPTATATLMPGMEVMSTDPLATATSTGEIAAAVGTTASKGISGWLAIPAVLLAGGAAFVGSRFLRRSA